MWRAAAGRQSCGVWVLSCQSERVWTFSPLGWKAASMSLAGAGRKKKNNNWIQAVGSGWQSDCEMFSEKQHISSKQLEEKVCERAIPHLSRGKMSTIGWTLHQIWTSGHGGLCRPWAGDWRPAGGCSSAYLTVSCCVCTAGFPPAAAADSSWTSQVCTSAAPEALEGQTERRDPQLEPLPSNRTEARLWLLRSDDDAAVSIFTVYETQNVTCWRHDYCVSDLKRDKPPLLGF